jgi:uncharacterized protein (TIGR03492 family)
VCRVLFVSNGHGEASIAERIAVELHALDESLVLEHFPLVGTGLGGGVMLEVGPRRPMPSGGLVAMGNVRAILGDLRAGFAGLFASQLRFLVRARHRYRAVLAVGDAYALGMALLAREPTVFVGTAKSAYVAPYGPFERAFLRKAARVFVRDERTAADLRAGGVPSAHAPGNVIVDLLGTEAPAYSGDWIGLLPGSRDRAYGDAVRLSRVVRALGNATGRAEALLSVAPGLDARVFAERLAADGWSVSDGRPPAPFVAEAQAARIVGHTGSLGALLRSSRLVLGQAGTANEAAAACGIPVVALDGDAGLGARWYRMRQRRLLGDALQLVPADPEKAAEALAALMADGARRSRMAAAGAERMGGGGGAAAIARETLRTLHERAAA